VHDSPRPRHSGAPLALSALCVLALSLAACDTTRNLMPDQPPTVTLTSGPIDTVSAPQSWLVDISWVGSDPDGRIDHYEYALDPPGLKQARFAQAETAWVKTTDHHVVARFHASHPDSLGPGATAPEFHVFVLRAVDDRGGISPDVVRAFYADHGIDALPVWLDPKGSAAEAWGARGLPTTLIVDRQGRETGYLEGAIDWAAGDTMAGVKRLVG